jgi:hypothetical protein
VNVANAGVRPSTTRSSTSNAHRQKAELVVACVLQVLMAELPLLQKLTKKEV